jgi:cytochrome P450
MGDTPVYRQQLDAMRAVVRDGDLDGLAQGAETKARELVAASGGRIDVVEMVRRVTFDLLCAYFGVSAPAEGRIDVWASRLFEFQFTGSIENAAWLAEVQALSAAFRDHLDKVIAARKAEGQGPDDVLRRCLALQAQGAPGYSDVEIRTALLCMVVGGPPQPPMVVPQALDQLLRRPRWLAESQVAARAGSDDALRRLVLEAMRFDPLAPGLFRKALEDWTIARGTSRARKIPKNARVLAAFASAMMDSRRIDAPREFHPDRVAAEYVHFGHGLHECFGRFINHATLHRMLKPLLEQPGLRRARGGSGRLSKRGGFADRLVVEFDAFS